MLFISFNDINDVSVDCAAMLDGMHNVAEDVSDGRSKQGKDNDYNYGNKNKN